MIMRLNTFVSDRILFQAIFWGKIAFVKAWKEIQVTNLLIWSDNSAAVFDLRRLIAIGTFAPAAKEIYHICQYSCMKITVLHVPGNINIITDALSRFCRSRDYHLHSIYLDQIRMIWNIQPTLYLFASSITKLLLRCVTANIEDLQAQWVDSFSYTWNNIILLINPQVPTLSRIVSYLNIKINTAIEIALWGLGLPWFSR